MAIAKSEAVLEARIRTRNIDAILRAATELFARRGFDGTRISDVAALADLPKANVYYYFRSKAALYAAVLRQVMDGWAEALDALSPDREPLAAIRAYIRAKIAYSRDNPLQSRVFASEILSGATRLSRTDREEMSRVAARNVAVLEQWVAQGKLRAVAPHHLLITIWAATQYYADFEILVADALQRESLTGADMKDAEETLVTTIILGLRPDDREGI